nr:hypothetical protein CFP56_76370 [Quercus suber]
MQQRGSTEGARRVPKRLAMHCCYRSMLARLTCSLATDVEVAPETDRTSRRYGQIGLFSKIKGISNRSLAQLIGVKNPVFRSLFHRLRIIATSMINGA